jgi:hypothetical protein
VKTVSSRLSEIEENIRNEIKGMREGDMIRSASIATNEDLFSNKDKQDKRGENEGTKSKTRSTLSVQ